MNCPKCGAPLADGAQFCTACGTPIAQETAQNTRPTTGGIQPNSNDIVKTLMGFNLVMVLGAILMFIALFLPFISSKYVSDSITIGGYMDCPTLVWLYAILIVAILVCVVLKKERLITYFTLIPMSGYLALIDAFGDSSDGWAVGFWFMMIGSVLCLVAPIVWKKLRPMIKL